MLLFHQLSKVLQKIFAQVVYLLQNLGFLAKRKKCSPIPSQHLIFLGDALDSPTMTLSLPQLKPTSIVNTCHHLLTLVGKMSHALQTGILFAPLHYRGPRGLHLQEWSQCRQTSKVIVLLTPHSHKDLEWWVQRAFATWMAVQFSLHLSTSQFGAVPRKNAGVQPTRVIPLGAIKMWKRRRGT